MALYCFVYIDDIIVYASSIQEHTEKLRAVFERLREHMIVLQPDKGEFLRHEVTYLGHIINEKDICPDPQKVQAVSKYPE